MEKNVLNTDLSGKVAVVTGASGTLCSIFAKALARAGAKVALLGRNMEKLKELANAIEAEGGVAKGYTCNVMNKANCLQVAEEVMADLGPCDILVNGAGGNNSRANTDKEFFEMADLDDDTVTFFDLDESGVEAVRQQMPDEDDLYDLAELYKVFGDSTRIKILYVLFGAELCVYDIARLLGMTQSAVSHQLRILKNNKLVKFRREGKTVFYGLDDDHVRSILKLGMEHLGD